MSANRRANFAWVQLQNGNRNGWLELAGWLKGSTAPGFQFSFISVQAIDQQRIYFLHQTFGRQMIIRIFPFVVASLSQASSGILVSLWHCPRFDNLTSRRRTFQACLFKFSIIAGPVKPLIGESLRPREARGMFQLAPLWDLESQCETKTTTTTTTGCSLV